MLEPWQKQGVSSNREDALTNNSSDESPPQPLLHDDLDLLEFDNDEGETTPLPTPWWRHRWVPIVSGVIVVAVVASIVGARMASAQKATTYQYGTVRQGNLALTVSGTGPVSANLYNLSFATSGTISQIDVSVGQTVKAGQTLAKLDPTALENAVSQAQLQAYIAYDQEQQALDKCNSSSNPPVDCVQLAENQYASAAQQLATAKANLANATLKATHAGVVTAINGAVGETPGSGSSSSGSSTSSSSSSGFIQIADNSALHITTSVNEADISGIANGQTATFTVTAYPSRIFRGTVSAVSQVGQSSSGVVTYPVTISVDTTTAQGANLFTGMTANVTITRAQRINVLLLPASAITFARAAANTNAGGFLTLSQLQGVRTQGRQMLTSLEQQNSQVSQDNPTVAWVVERSNNKWVVKPVVLGLSNGTVYEVLAGLNA
ncbi:MAG TPA: efflux RND transporter periplasmic adaptor subunit, partial [Ktedonobacterales bacterium]|nr:efflux RND transporter periplasmic adaptor subunit [Ktedonobacterales bacterium]